MNRSLLELLYRGEIYPNRVIQNNDPESVDLRRKISTEMKHFAAILSPEEYLRLQKLDEMIHEELSAYIFENFAYGFRLGTVLMMETLAGGKGFTGEIE